MIPLGTIDPDVADTTYVSVPGGDVTQETAPPCYCEKGRGGLYDGLVSKAPTELTRDVTFVTRTYSGHTAFKDADETNIGAFDGLGMLLSLLLV